jgi:hypothetical protein
MHRIGSIGFWLGFIVALPGIFYAWNTLSDPNFSYSGPVPILFGPGGALILVTILLGVPLIIVGIVSFPFLCISFVTGRLFLLLKGTRAEGARKQFPAVRSMLAEGWKIAKK